MKTKHQPDTPNMNSSKITRFRNYLNGAFALTAAALLASPQTHAASAVWNVDAGGNWVDGSNWNPAAAPGSTSITNSTDIATFSTSITAARSITPDANRNIGGITFSHNSVFGYSIGGDVLLSSGGEILSDASGSHFDRQTGIVYIQGDGGSATFRNISASSNTRLIFNAVRGVSTAENTTTLYLDGTNTAVNSIQSIISNGNNGGSLAVVKNGTGLWRFDANNTYTGGTILNAGFLDFSLNATAFGTGALTLNGGTLRAVAAGTVTLANAIEVGGNFAFSHSNTGAVVTFSGNVNLGNTTRTITTNTANTNLTFSGVISNGGLTKAGNATSELTLAGINTYTGDTTVNSGILNLADNAGLLFMIGANGVNNKITGTGTVNLDGDFTFDLSGAAVVNGNSWTIVDVGTLTETFGATFSVNGFTADSGGDFWTLNEGLNTWTFTESTGVLNVSVVPEPGAVMLFMLGMATLLFRRHKSRF